MTTHDQFTHPASVPITITPMKYTIAVALSLSLFACKKEEPAPPPAPVVAQKAKPPAPAPVVSTQTAVTLPAGSPIPGSGVLLWLAGDDALTAAKDGKVQSWQNAAVPNVTAKAVHDDHPPAAVANAIN